jgi:hypothetical protein
MQGSGRKKLATATTMLIAVIERIAILKWQLRLAHALNGAAGLPCSDEQKKTRLRSHLSA